MVHDEVVDGTITDDGLDLVQVMLCGPNLHTVNEYDLLTYEQIRVIADAIG